MFTTGKIKLGIKLLVNWFIFMNINSKNVVLVPKPIFQKIRQFF